jgi:proliferating cell nuclear antigen
MFEARMKEASLLKKIVEALKDLVVEGNFDCSPSGIQLQVFTKFLFLFFSLLTFFMSFSRQWTLLMSH